MKKILTINTIILLLSLSFSLSIFSQTPYLSYTPKVQTISVASGVETTATVMVNWYGSGSTQLFADATLCTGDYSSFLGVTGSTFLNFGGVTNLVFKFKNTVTTNTTVVYKFSTNQSCMQNDSDMIKITVNYIASTTNPAQCELPYPKNFNLTDITTTSVTLHWDLVQGASNFRILYYKDEYEFFNNPRPIVSNYQNSYVLNGLKSGTTYSVTVIPICSDGSYGHAGGLAPYGSSTNFTTLCIPATAATNLTATPNGSGYTINFLPATSSGTISYYMMDYVDLSNNSTGSLTIYNGAYFYYVSPPKSFKFKIRAVGGCNVPDSEWKTIIPSNCTIQSPTNLQAISQCAPTKGSQCGGIFRWDAVPNSNGYQAEYMVSNLSGQSIPVVTFVCSSNSFSYPAYVSTSQLAGPYVLNFRVRSKCSNGTWGAFSNWSASFAW